MFIKIIEIIEIDKGILDTRLFRKIYFFNQSAINLFVSTLFCWIVVFTEK